MEGDRARHVWTKCDFACCPTPERCIRKREILERWNAGPTVPAGRVQAMDLEDVCDAGQSAAAARLHPQLKPYVTSSNAFLDVTELNRAILSTGKTTITQLFASSIATAFLGWQKTIGIANWKGA
jgi:hypothetical protein